MCLNFQFVFLKFASEAWRGGGGAESSREKQAESRGRCRSEG